MSKDCLQSIKLPNSNGRTFTSDYIAIIKQMAPNISAIKLLIGVWKRFFQLCCCKIALWTKTYKWKSKWFPPVSLKTHVLIYSVVGVSIFALNISNAICHFRVDIVYSNTDGIGILIQKSWNGEPSIVMVINSNLKLCDYFYSCCKMWLSDFTNSTY